MQWLHTAQAQRAVPNPQRDVIVEITSPPLTAERDRYFDSTMFLSLTPVRRVVDGGQYGTIILDKFDCANDSNSVAGSLYEGDGSRNPPSRVYVHGIYLRKMRTNLPYSVNLAGGDVAMNRDRAMIGNVDLLNELGEIWQYAIEHYNEPAAPATQQQSQRRTSVRAAAAASAASTAALAQGELARDYAPAFMLLKILESREHRDEHDMSRMCS